MGHSKAIRGHQRAHKGSSEGTQRLIRGNHRLSETTQWQSAAISGNQQRSEGTGPKTATVAQDGQRHHWWRATAARAPVCCAIVVRISRAADDPSSAALVLRVPALQGGNTPADFAAVCNGNAEVRAFFASGQVRPIRVHSEILRGHHRALRGQAEAIRGTQWTSEGSQRPVSGTQRPSEAIRGQPEALTGNQRAIREHPWQSFAISSTQSHSVAIKRAPGPKTATMATSRAERAPCVCVCACSQHLEATPGQSAAAAAEAAADNAAMNSAAMVAVSATRRTFALECGQQGLGLELDSTNTIITVKPGGRAEQQGLVRLDDVILSVDGKSLAGKLMQEVMVPGRPVYVVEILRQEKVAADKAAADKAQQEAEDAQLAAALAASLAVSGPVPPPPRGPPPPTAADPFPSTAARTPPQLHPPQQRPAVATQQDQDEDEDEDDEEEPENEEEDEEEEPSDAEKQAALERLLQVTVPVHLISAPYEVRAGYDKAREIKEDNHNPPHSYCYNPNTDSPQDAGGGWLQSWIKVCKRTKQTNGTVYVVFNRRKNGRYGDGKYKGWFDGQAQGGELELAETLNCTISFVGYTAFY